MSYPHEINAGDKFLDAFNAPQWNGMLREVRQNGPEIPSASRPVLDPKIDWQVLCIPCKVGTYPAALVLEEAKHIRAFVGRVAGAVVSLGGSAFTLGAPPAYQNLTGDFWKTLGAIPAAAVSATPPLNTEDPPEEGEELPQANALTVTVVSVPASDKPPFLELQIGYCR